MFSNGFELFVEVGGRRIPEYGHRGKTFVEGRRAHRYEVKFRNNRAERVFVAPTVDGKNVIDGTVSSDRSGYVVQPYSSLTISGWRSSLSEVNLFEFSERHSSYAGKTDGTANCGVIGVQVWSEKLNYVPPQQIHIHHFHTPIIQEPTIYYTSSTSDMLGAGPQYTCKTTLSGEGPTGDPGLKGYAGEPGAQDNLCRSNAMSAPDFNLGTAFGAKATDVVNQTSFEKGLWLAMMEIYYSDADGLAKDGITVNKAPTIAVYPQSFGSFCKPPTY